jgi:hypothetical protein
VLGIDQPHVLAGQFVQRMTGQAEVLDAFDHRMLFEELGDLHACCGS